MTAFQVPKVPHAVSAQVDDAVELYHTFGQTIPTDVALAIAGWFCSPNSEDMPYTILAQSGKGDTEALGVAIHRDLNRDDLQLNMDARRCLEALDEWVSLLEDA